ncbi:MAG: CheR family methyltransferase, partial [Pirellula sp.]
MRCLVHPKILLVGLLLAASIGGYSFGQKTVRKPDRAKPPQFQSSEFSGVFFADARSQLQGSPSLGNPTQAAEAQMAAGSDAGDSEPAAKGNDVWKQLISGPTVEDLVKESKSRVDGIITTPAKFASGGYGEARREFTLLGSLMGIIAQYPEDIRWKSSAPYARTAFARMAANCKVGTQPVYNEAKLRQQDLQDLLKGTKLNGTAEETSWVGRRARERSLVIWSAACSTGQEPYSIAMLLHEHFRDLLAAWRVRIIASDFSEAALARAREGVYSGLETARGLTPQLLAKHFRPLQGKW